jgi:hypothetical protein
MSLPNPDFLKLPKGTLLSTILQLLIRAVLVARVVA